MEKVGACLTIVFLLIGFVSASWGDIGTGDGDDAVIPDDPVVDTSGGDDDSSSGNSASSDSGGDDNTVVPSSGNSASSDSEFFYTRNFFIALGVGGVGLLILALFLYLFFRSPRNKWK